MTKEEDGTFSRAGARIDRQLSDLLGELGAAFSEALDRLEEAGESEIRREGTFETGKGPIRASAGVRIRTLGGTASAFGSAARRPERPVRQEGAASPEPRRDPEAAQPGRGPAAARAPEPPEPPAQREIVATIIDEPSGWTLVADLPGIAREDVTLAATDEGALVIAARRRDRRFEGRFELPPGLRVEDLGLEMNNGILELHAPRGDRS